MGCSVQFYFPKLIHCNFGMTTREWNILLYCPTLGTAIVDLLNDFRTLQPSYRLVVMQLFFRLLRLQVVHCYMYGFSSGKYMTQVVIVMDSVIGSPPPRAITASYFARVIDQSDRNAPLNKITYTVFYTCPLPLTLSSIHHVFSPM